MLRPIDMTLSIQHAADAARAGQQGALAARPEVASRMFADRLEKQAEQQTQQAVEVTQAEKHDVNPDRKGQGGGYNQSRKRASKPEKEKTGNKLKPTGESLYDIKI
ncbi:MAG: hypothetical protein FWF79_09415 [Defluviitaleaceae bacterium]|nr:hypothetical protein [Defluviitaleaceae bacterium]